LKAFYIPPLKGLFICGLLLFSALAAAGATVPANREASLTVAVEKDTAAVGELLWLTLTYSLPEGGRLTDPLSISGLEALGIVDRVVEPQRIRFRFVVDRLQSLDIGTVRLRYRSADGEEQQVASEPVTITVVSNLGEKPEEAVLRPIQDILPTGSKGASLLPWIVVAVLFLIAIAVWWRRRRRLSRQQDRTEAEPPYRRAEKEIDRLVKEGLFERGEVKAFYFRFSEIVRRYVGAVRGLAAVEMTTEEIAGCLGNHPPDRLLLPLLRRADMVKFSDLMPSPNRKDRDLSAVRDYIRDTRPAPEDGERQEGDA